jgi:hypothetical protein
MKWRIEYSPKQKFIRINLEGKFSVEGHLEMIKDILSQAFWRPGMNVLFDNRRLDYGSSSFEAMTQASRNQAAHDEDIGDGKAALLMKSVADFGLGRQYEIITDEKISANVHVFLDENQAIRWLEM